jgi:hypothetical protein
VNSIFNLEKKISENRLVRKVMRSFPKGFRPKFTAIEKTKDLDTMKIEELVSSLQTYKLTLTQPKKKTLTLKNMKEEASNTFGQESIDDEDLTLIAKWFKKTFRPSNCESRKPSQTG